MVPSLHIPNGKYKVFEFTETPWFVTLPVNVDCPITCTALGWITLGIGLYTKTRLAIESATIRSFPAWNTPSGRYNEPAFTGDVAFNVSAAWPTTKFADWFVVRLHPPHPGTGVAVGGGVTVGVGLFVGVHVQVSVAVGTGVLVYVGVGVEVGVFVTVVVDVCVAVNVSVAVLLAV